MELLLGTACYPVLYIHFLILTAVGGNIFLSRVQKLKACLEMLTNLRKATH